MSPVKQFEHQLTLCRAPTWWWNFQGERQISTWVTGLSRNISEKQRKLKSLSFLWYTISINSVNCELQDIHIGFRKGRGIRDQIANIHWIIKKPESSRKTLISALLTMPKTLTVWITTNCGKFLKRSEYQTTWPASWETCMQVRKQQLEPDMEQQTGSK